MSEYIFNLVKTLNKTEKSRFTESFRQTKRLKYYKKMLAIYGSEEAYSSDLDRRVFKDVEGKLVYDCKAHFKDSLNSFLTSSKRFNSHQETIRKNFEIGCMLMNRLLHREAYKVLRKTYQLAKDCHEFLYAIMISEQIMYLERHEDITKYRVDIDNIKLRHSLHMKDLEDYVNFRTEFHLLWENLGMFYEKEGFRPYKRPSMALNGDKSFRLKYIIAEKEYYGSLLSDDLDKQYERLRALLNTIYDHKDDVKRNSNVKRNYYSYLCSFISLCINLKKFDSIDFAFAEFDFYSSNNSLEYNDSLKYKLQGMCNYAIYLGKHQMVKTLENEFLSRRITKKDFLAISCFVSLLYVYFMARKFDKCKEYIKRLDKCRLNAKTLTKKEIIRIISAIEENEYTYASTLISTFFNKSKLTEDTVFLKRFIKCLKLLVDKKEDSFVKLAKSILVQNSGLANQYALFYKYIAAKSKLIRSEEFTSLDLYV